ncbi:hypothetical protein D9M71_277750 [compost metagenome]
MRQAQAIAVVQRGQWYGQHLAGFACDKEHLRGHLGHQRAVRVVDIQQHAVLHHLAAGAAIADAGRAAAALAGLLQRLGRDRQHLSHRAGPAAFAASQGGEVGGHARFDLADVGLRYLGPHGHWRELGDAQDQRGLLLGVEGLPFAGVHRYHRAVHGRVDACVAQLGFVAAQARLGLTDLRLEHVDARLGDLQLRGGRLHVFVAGGAGGGQVALAFELLLGQQVLRALLGQLGLKVVDRVAPGIQPRLLGGGVDLDQQLAFAYRVTDLDVQRVDLPGRLGTDVHVAPWLQGTQRGDAAFDVGAGHGDRAERLCAIGQGLPGQQAAQAEQAQASEQDPATGVG